MKPKIKYINREDIIKRSMAYAASIIFLVVLVTALILSSHSVLNTFLNVQMQIIITASIVLVLALFVQYRQTTDSTANAMLHQQLEIIHLALEAKNKEISARQKEIEQDLKTALILQQTLLNRFKPQINNMDIGIRSVPASSIGGDFYEFMQPDKTGNRVDIVIGDVAGHGVPASLITVLSIMSFSELAKGNQDPGVIMGKANTMIEEYIKDTPVPFVTAFYASYNPEARKMRYARAGHPAPLLKRNGQWIELEGKGVILGAFAGSSYEANEIEIKKGDILILYTDGLTEARGADGEMYGTERLQSIVDKAADVSLNAACDAIFNDVRKYSGNVQQDDETLIILSL
ncbi:MAG: PP2C family protein-serine/threonine phosphatase [Candidatus Margulisiibacteriota bacterium]